MAAPPPLSESAAVVEASPDELAVRTFVGRNADHYIGVWRPFRDEAVPFPRFNWAAFFLGPFWLGYRKLLKPLAIYFAVMFATVLIEDAVVLPRLGMERLPRVVDLVINLAFAITVGKFANYWYWRLYEREIARANASSADAEGALRHLAERGGASWVWAFAGPGVFYLGFMVLYLIIVLIVGFPLEAQPG